MKIIRSFLLILLLLVTTGCTNISLEDYFQLRDDQKNNEAVNNNMEVYPQLTDKQHIYEVIDADKALELINNKETCILVMGFKECPWCQAVIPYVNEVAKEEGLTKIYYIDIKYMRDNPESLDYSKYLELKEHFKDAVDLTKDRINAPTTIALKDGKMVGFHLDTVSSHVLEEGILPPLNNEQERELKEIIKNLINKIK